MARQALCRRPCRRDIRMLTLDGTEVTQEEVVFREIKARIRDVRISPAGMLYIH